MNLFGFTLTTQDFWLLRICGALITIWIVYRLSVGLKKRNSFNEATETFRNIFENIRATILQNPDLTASQIVDDILKRNYPEQRIAMGSLSKQMWYFKRCAFSKAWRDYVNPEDCGNEPFLSYCGIPWEVGKSFDRQYILNAIEHLISLVNK